MDQRTNKYMTYTSVGSVSPQLLQLLIRLRVRVEEWPPGHRRAAALSPRSANASILTIAPCANRPAVRRQTRLWHHVDLIEKRRGHAEATSSMASLRRLERHRTQDWGDRQEGPRVQAEAEAP